MKRLATARKVFGALGGVPSVARLTKSKLKSVYYWHTSGRFPASTCLVMTWALDQLGYSAPGELWRQRGLENRTAAEINRIKRERRDVKTIQALKRAERQVLSLKKKLNLT
jgi:hypothetical protein